MRKAFSLALFSSVIFSFPAFALEALSDTDLAKKTGKDGLSVGIQGDGLTRIRKVRYIDSDGFQSGSIDHSNKAGVSTNLWSAIRSCSTTSSIGCTLSKAPLKIDIDTDGGTDGNAFINIGITSAAKAFYVPISSVSLVSGTNTQGNWSGDTNILELKDAEGKAGGISIDMDNVLSANIQLGSQPQGAMLLLGGNNIDIDFGTLNILSYGLQESGNSQISTQLSVNDLGFSGIAVDIDGKDGIVMKSGENTTIGAVNINETTLGSAGSADANAFNGLQNGSIGNISMTGIAIKNLQVNVKGL